MQIINLIVHLDRYMLEMVYTYHTYIYLALFIVVFCETGLVVLPFLPGDSLLFIAGGIAATGNLNIGVLAAIIFTAAFCGDNCNFFMGKLIGNKLFVNPKSKIFRKDILDKTHQFYKKHGHKAIIIARFIPLIRTFAPFAAGLGRMAYARFIGFSIAASLLWVFVLLGGGYLFGNLPLVKTHLSSIMIFIIILSIVPAIKIVIDEIRQKTH